MNLEVRTDAAEADTGRSLRQRILSAAFNSFMHHGYAGTSTLEIATRAKVSKRDLYSLFGSKQAMLGACIQERAERMRLPLHLPPPRTPEALRMTLERFGTTLLREASRPEVLAVFRLAIAEAERSPDIARTLEDAGRIATMAKLGELMGAAQAAGLLGAGDPRDLAGLFFAVLWGGLHVRLLLRVADPPDEAQAARQARAATDALVRLYPPTNPGAG